MSKYVCFPDTFGAKVEGLFKEALEGWGARERDILESEIDVEEYAEVVATGLDSDMRRYMSGDTDIPGNFRDIRINYGEGFGELVERMREDGLSVSEKDWIDGWFWDAFGSWGMVYNFDSYCSEIIYEYGK